MHYTYIYFSNVANFTNYHNISAELLTRLLYTFFFFFSVALTWIHSSKQQASYCSRQSNLSPLPKKRLLYPSLSSKASWTPVEAPLGTAARKRPEGRDRRDLFVPGYAQPWLVMHTKEMWSRGCAYTVYPSPVQTELNMIKADTGFCLCPHFDQYCDLLTFAWRVVTL